jgi:hypothetical protein
MKKLIMAIVVVTTILFNASAFAGEANVYHMVLVDLKDGVTPKQVEEMITVCNALLSQIPGVLEVSMGIKALENRDIHIKDYDVALCVKWENIETGKVYGPHILHQSFLKLYKPLIAGLKIIDFYGS